MANDTQRLIRELFDAASELPIAERQAWVESRASGNAEVISSVLRLLRASNMSAGSSANAFLNEPAWKRETAALQEGMMIGPYRVLRELGSGGMGVVYLTMRSDEVFRRLAALKVIRPELRNDPLVARFLREREILARLDHQNIARIVDGGTTPDGLPYFVMDYVDGQPLDIFCRERRAPMQQRLNLFRQTCEAVQYLHEHNVLHRDLKPANILVTHNGQVKLLDFGVSKVEGELQSTATTGMPILTAGYASPEQITSKKVTSSSDIYSLGVVLYELLTGVRPLRFDGLGLPEILNSVSTQTPLKPSSQSALPPNADPGNLLASMRPQLAGDLDSILMMALRKEPERRYASAADFSADIERFQTGRPVIARGDARSYIVGRTLLRYRIQIVIALIFAILLGSGGVVTYKFMERGQQIDELTNRLQQVEKRTAKAEAMHDPALRVNLQRDLNQLSSDYDTQTPAILNSKLAPRAKTQQLVNQSLQFLSKADADAGSDPAVLAALGRVYLSVAQTQWSPDHASLNDASNAAHTCLTALKALHTIPSLRTNPQSLLEVQQVAGKITSLLEQNPAMRQLQ